MALGPFSLPLSASASSSSPSTLMAISNITSRVRARASAKCHFYIDLCPNRLAIGRRGENERASLPGKSQEVKRPSGASFAWQLVCSFSYHSLINEYVFKFNDLAFTEDLSATRIV